MLLTGKTALVTGASRGIGQVIAKQLAEQGAQVIGTATTEAGAKAISAFFEQAGLPGVGLMLDVNQEDSVAQAFTTLTERGMEPTILINNAGITRDNLMLRMKQEEWDAVLSTNLTGVFKVTRLCLKPMLKARWGRIISISSLAGVAGNPGQANYAASKAGLIGFSKSLAYEVASRGITVNVVAPGLIESDMSLQLTDSQRQQILAKTPVGRMGSAEEIASAVIFLASPLASYITGETLNINGGMYMS